VGEEVDLYSVGKGAKPMQGLLWLIRSFFP